MNSLLIKLTNLLIIALLIVHNINPASPKHEYSDNIIRLDLSPKSLFLDALQRPTTTRPYQALQGMKDRYNKLGKSWGIVKPISASKLLPATCQSNQILLDELGRPLSIASQKEYLDQPQITLKDAIKKNEDYGQSISELERLIGDTSRKLDTVYNQQRTSCDPADLKKIEETLVNLELSIFLYGILLEDISKQQQELSRICNIPKMKK